MPFNIFLLCRRHHQLSCGPLIVFPLVVNLISDREFGPDAMAGLIACATEGGGICGGVQGRVAVYRGPVGKLPTAGTVAFRLRRGCAFAPDVHLDAASLQVASFPLAPTSTPSLHLFCVCVRAHATEGAWARPGLQPPLGRLRAMPHPAMAPLQLPSSVMSLCSTVPHRSLQCMPEGLLVRHSVLVDNR